MEALAQVRAFVRTVTLLLPDEGIAEHHGDLKAELARLGMVCRSQPGTRTLAW